MKFDFFQVIKKWRAFLILPFVLIFAGLFSHQNLMTFSLTALILYGIGLLFVYEKARWLAFVVLGFLPSFTSALLLRLPGNFSNEKSLVFLVIFLFSLILAYRLARRENLIDKIALKHFPWLKILLGVLALFVASYLLSFVGRALGSTATSNQTALNQLQAAIPLWIFASQSIFAGFFEELAYRVGPFELIFPKHRLPAFVMAVLLFTLLHEPNNLYSWLLYGLMSLILTSLYAKYRNFYLNASVHMLWNSLVLLLPLILR